MKAIMIATALTASLIAQSTKVYITAKGMHYHTNRNCIALRTAKVVKEIDITETKLELCSICARVKHSKAK